MARVGHWIRRFRQRRLARSVSHQWPRLPRSAAGENGSGIRTAQDRVSQPRQWTVHRRDRAARPARPDPAGGPGGAGPPVTTPKAGRGTAFGDFDNDGQIDVAIANVNDRPDLFRGEGNPRHHWITLQLTGVASN